MSYQVIVPRPVQKQLDALPTDVRERIIARMQVLKESPRPHGAIKLKGTQHEYRIRIATIAYGRKYMMLSRSSSCSTAAIARMSIDHRHAPSAAS